MAPDTDATLGPALLARARWAIGKALGVASGEAPSHPSFSRRAACFVTLKRNGELRGCIGSINAQRELGADLDQNAVGAALRDHRFSPLTAEEFRDVEIEVSLLSRPEFLDCKSEREALEQIRPGIDGVIFFNGCRQATFLPQVWEQLPEPDEFLGRLKEKAGVRADFWSSAVMIATYQVLKFREGA